MSAFQKKAIFLSIFIAFFVTLWKKDEHEYIKPKNQASWIHYKKDEKGKLIQNIVGPEEIAEINSQKKLVPSHNGRLPASKDSHKQEPDSPAQKVVFINPSNPKVKPELNDLKFVNSYNPEWKELLAKELMLFQPESVEVYFKPQKSVVKILENNHAMFLEEVSVTYKTNLGPHSFKALVNSETGKVIETWGKTHYDNFSPRMPASENKGLTPNGTL